MPHLLRVDARENRVRVLAAARELFAESGLEVTMRQIARRAGVGPATLYRRFPTKQDLVFEAFENELAECGSIVHDGAADPDPWRGFCDVLERTLLLHARDGLRVADTKANTRTRSAAGDGSSRPHPRS